MSTRTSARLSPLGKWLQRHPQISQTRFVELMTAQRGARVYPSNVCQWANAKQDPSDATIVDIEAVTKSVDPADAVIRQAWSCWRRRNRAAARAAANS